MPKKLDKTTSSENKSTLPLSCRIIGEFYIENFHFFIISAADFTEAATSLNDDLVLARTPFAVCGHFDFGGNSCLIVNGQSICEDLEPDITSILTERELQIAALVALGWSNKQVAQKLGISEWTVSAHLRRIFIKLDVDSRAAMVYRCSSLIHQMHQLLEVQSLDVDPHHPELSG
ncbi:MAG: hypothetical protein B0A82_26710 [Alkalinema sp. CACIAM 70d]|nr:MAG: hypothetical protein B0A82_26710 [Alkalinema sp. CACIAM 70d]